MWMACAFCFRTAGGWCAPRTRSRCWCCVSRQLRLSCWTSIRRKWRRQSSRQNKERQMENCGELPRKLSWVDATAIVIGIVIGSGIFLLPNLIARELSSPAAILSVWIISGVLSYFGALAYAELGAMMPATGGQYVYLREAYGPLCAFVCGWTFMLAVMSGGIAWLAVSFSIYLGQFVHMAPAVSKLVSVALIAAVSAV